LTFRKKIEKLRKSVLTVWAGADYIRLTNEGGAPLATKKFASETALERNQESRVSDTRPGPKPKATGPTTSRLRCLFFDN
jgi:hypothetical protein